MKNMNKPLIALIHGANATRASFNYVAHKLDIFDIVYLDHDQDEEFSVSLDRMKRLLPQGRPVFLVGHSLGGIYAVHLAKDVSNICGAVSICTPFAGSSLVQWVRFVVPKYKIFTNVSANAAHIKYLADVEISIPWTQIVTTAGEVPWHKSPNDGVVTRESMICRTDVDYVEIPYNHYEAVCADETVDVILDRYMRTTR